MTPLNRAQEEKVVVFGANGFLGSVITNRLYESGINVLPVVRPGAKKPRIKNLENLIVFEVNSGEWPRLVTEQTPSAVICAQWNGVSKKDREDFELQKTNFDPILNIANAAKTSGVKSFICLGSQAEAKESLETIKEEFYDSGESAYGSIKAKLHSYLSSLFLDSDCRFVWARIFSVYGPSDFSNSLLKQLFDSQLSGEELVISNPSKYWSYLYQDDFASAIEQILTNPCMANTVNVGNPTLNEIKEIAATWYGHSPANHAKYPAEPTNVGYFPDVEKLRTAGWVPSISLKEGIDRTRKAFSEHIISK